MELELVGLNLEGLLSRAAQAGVRIRAARRVDVRTMRVCIDAAQRGEMKAICARFGWTMREVRAGLPLRMARWLRVHGTRVAAVLLFVALTAVSSRLMLAVRVENAGKDAAEVQRVLREAGLLPGRPKRTVSTDALRETLLLRLPDLAYVSVNWAGSTLVIDCREALTGEQALVGGAGLDLVASEPGIVTRIWVLSGTPAVEPGQAVRAGQVLIRGEERGEQGSMHAVKAQGEVTARVWARGDAKVSRYVERTVETGAVRRRVTLRSPWTEKTVRGAEPFDSQDSSVDMQPVVGLYLPVWREIETMAEIVSVRERRDDADAASMAQGAAQQLAKLKCPSGVEILDKWVDYSMIDDEFVYATVVLEYEHSIAVRADGVP